MIPLIADGFKSIRKKKYDTLIRKLVEQQLSFLLLSTSKAKEKDSSCPKGYKNFNKATERLKKALMMVDLACINGPSNTFVNNKTRSARDK